MSVVPGSSPPLDEDFVTPCASNVDLYLHPLLEDPPSGTRAPRADVAEYQRLVAAARQSCSSCPLLPECMYRAVVHTDISGYVGCTTAGERTAIREHIGIVVESEDFDSFAGARGERQPVAHADVLRARAQHPDDSLEALAARLGCSLSTVKRHLRRARHEGADEGDEPVSRAALPSMDEVFDAFEEVVEPDRPQS